MKSKFISLLAFCSLFALCAMKGIDLKSRQILNGQATILVPKEFKKQDSITLATRYNSTGSNPPQEAWASDNGRLTVTASIHAEHIQPEQIKELRTLLLAQVKAGKGIEVMSDAIETINGRETVIIIIRAPIRNGSLYSMMMCVPLNNRIFVGGFNVSADLMEEWQSVGWEVIRSVKIN